MISNSAAAPDPHLRRWMLFVDGENIAIRARSVAAAHGLSLSTTSCYVQDVFAWMPGVAATKALVNGPNTPIRVQDHAVRAYCYTSVYGDDDAVLRVRDALWTLGFCPAVFKKSRREAKAKGVDIAMTKDLLSHAHYGNYDVAVVMTGDGDYVPVIEEVKRLGKVVYVVAFASTGMSGELRLTSDMFFDIESTFIQQWQRGYPSNDA